MTAGTFHSVVLVFKLILPYFRYNAYQQAAAQFVIYEANLLRKETAAAEIDMAITQCITKVSRNTLFCCSHVTWHFQARPVYIALPMDLVKEEISSDRLSVPLSSTGFPNDPDTESFVLDLIQERVTEIRGDVVVLVDACVIRHHCRNEVLDLLKKTSFPVYGTPMGKTAIEEDYKRYGGVCFIPHLVIRDSNSFRFILGPCPTRVSRRK